MMSKVTVFLADDHAILRDGLKAILSADSKIEFLGEEGDGREALFRVKEIKPDILVTDISMPSLNGIELSRELKRSNPEIKILILSQYDNDEYINELLSIGIDGYILKTNAKSELLQAINQIINGNSYLSPSITSRLMKTFSSSGKGSMHEIKSCYDLLSPREREIIKLIAEGKSNKEMADVLCISIETVKTHRSNLMKKLGLKNIAEVVKYALKEKLIDL